MERKGSDLIFISWIKRDGSGVQPVPLSLIHCIQKDTFTLHGLSMTEGTYIACEFNSFVVKLKEERTNGLNRSH